MTTIVSLSLYSLLFATPGLAGHCPADYPHPYSGNCASASWCCSVAATDTGYCGNGDPDHCYGDGTPCSDPPCRAPTPAPTAKPTTTHAECPADYPQPYDGNCASASWCCSVVATDTGYCGNGHPDHCYGDGTPCSDPPCRAPTTHCPADYPQPYDGNCASASWCCSVVATDTGYCGNGNRDHCYGDGTPCSDPPCQAALVDLAEEEEQEKEKDLLPPTTLTVTAGPMLKLINAGASNSELAEDTSPIPQRDVPAALWVCALGALALSTVAVAARKRSSVPDAYLNLAGEPQAADTSA